jgi:WW domain-containing oxidoreductase
MATEIGRSYGFFNKVMMTLLKPFTKTLEQGAATTVYCAILPNLDSGKYWENCFDDQKNLLKNIACDEALQV